MESAKNYWLIFIFFPALADASHHRGHAEVFADQVTFHLLQMENRLDLYVESCPQANETAVEVLYRYSGFIRDNMARVRGILSDQSGDLDEARRIVTRPNFSRPNSSANLALGLVHRVRQLMQSCPSAHLAGVLQRISLAWEGIDHVAWHINDAIREEVYLDREFVCSGPNNHC